MILCPHIHLIQTEGKVIATLEIIHIKQSNEVMKYDFLIFWFVAPCKLGSCRLQHMSSRSVPVNKYMLKIKNSNTKQKCEICSKLTIRTIRTREQLVIHVKHELFFFLSVLFNIGFENINVRWIMFH